MLLPVVEFSLLVQVLSKRREQACLRTSLCLIEITFCLQAGVYLHIKDRAAARLASVETRVRDNSVTAVEATPASEPLPTRKGPTGHPAGNPKTKKVSLLIWVQQFWS